MDSQVRSQVEHQHKRAFAIARRPSVLNSTVNASRSSVTAVKGVTAMDVRIDQKTKTNASQRLQKRNNEVVKHSFLRLLKRKSKQKTRENKFQKT